MLYAGGMCSARCGMSYMRVECVARGVGCVVWGGMCSAKKGYSGR